MRLSSALRFRRDEGGAVVPWIAGGMTAIMSMAALAIDAGHFYLEQSRLQATADSTALVASAVMTSGGNAQDAADAAIEHAEKDLPPETYGAVLSANDVVSGEWDARTDTFSPGGAGNAVQVTLRRTAATGNPVSTYLAGVLGYRDMDLVVWATATVGWCGGGTLYMAAGTVTMGQDMRLNAGTCVYGAEGVAARKDLVVKEGAYIGAADIDTIALGQDPSIPVGAVGELQIMPTVALGIDRIIADLQAGNNLPPQITEVQVRGSLPDTLASGTAYVITNSVRIDLDYTLTDVIIASTGSISFGENGRLRNSQGSCPAGGIAIGLFAAKNISVGQNAVIEGVQMAAGENVSIGQDLGALNASIQAGNDISIGQDPEMMGCDCAMPGGAGKGTVARLVL